MIIDHTLLSLNKDTSQAMSYVYVVPLEIPDVTVWTWGWGLAVGENYWQIHARLYL